MGLGQTMVTAGFFVVLVVMFMNAYRVMSNADEELLITSAYKTASDLGQSLMAEIVTKKYDQNYNPPASPGSYGSGSIKDSFTPSGQLGPEETIPLPDQSPFQSVAKYNDVDDYNHYSRITDSTNGLGRFRDSVLVYYVLMTNPPSVTSNKWWTKRIEVWVTSDKWLTNKWVKLYSVVGCSTK